MLSYRVLRAANSAAFSVQREVTSLRGALVLLGVAQIKKWVSVWALAGLSDGTSPGAVAAALIRARCCERLGELLSRRQADSYFLLGLYSLLDVILKRPMETALSDTPVPAEIREALADILDVHGVVWVDCDHILVAQKDMTRSSKYLEGRGCWRLAPGLVVLLALFFSHHEALAQTGPVSGYMELHLNKPVDDPVAPAVLDFHRFVLLFSHSFTPRLRFVGELELEHAVVEGFDERGELELEQAYLDVLLAPALNFRAGMLLAPVGIINERHEPPTFHGVERPFVDTVIIPTTWFDAGAGVHGTIRGKVRYRIYAMAPLDSAAFTAEEGLRDAAQHGAEAQVRDVAWTGRAEYVGVRGLQVGVSFWRGASAVTLPRFETSTGMIEADVRYARGRFEGRGEYAHGFIGGAAELNDAVGRLTGISPNVARQIRGFYLEGAYRALPRRWSHDAAVFLRYENFDTQFRMDGEDVRLPEFDRDAWVVGATYWLDPDVALKMDYSHVRSQSAVLPSPRTFNVGIGWWF